MEPSLLSLSPSQIESCDPLIRAWAFWPLAPILKLPGPPHTFQPSWSHPVSTQHTPSYPSGDSKGFRSCWPGTLDKGQRFSFYFLSQSFLLYHKQLAVLSCSPQREDKVWAELGFLKHPCNAHLGATRQTPGFFPRCFLSRLRPARHLVSQARR